MKQITKEQRERANLHEWKPTYGYLVTVDPMCGSNEQYRMAMLWDGTPSNEHRLLTFAPLQSIDDLELWVLEMKAKKLWLTRH